VLARLLLQLDLLGKQSLNLLVKLTDLVNLILLFVLLLFFSLNLFSLFVRAPALVAMY